MKLFTMIALVFPLVCAGAEGTNGVFATNWYTAPANFRVVAGQLYNIDKSGAWRDYQCEVAWANSNLVHGTLFVDRVRRYGGGPNLLTNPAKSEFWRDYKDPVIITNFSRVRPSRGDRFRFRAMQTEVRSDGTLLLDCGADNRVLMVYSNGIPWRKAEP